MGSIMYDISANYRSDNSLIESFMLQSLIFENITENITFVITIYFGGRKMDICM